MSGGVMESLIALGMCFGGLFVFAIGFRMLRAQRLLEDTPTSRIGSMAMGFVEVQGSIAPRSRVVAPFSGRPCAYWEVEISTRSENERKSGGLRQWTPVHIERSGHPFFLQDESGVALVFPQGADVRAPWTAEEETMGFGVPEMYMDYMKEKNLHMRALWAVGPMRFRERVLENGLAMYVIGRAHPKAMAQSISDDEVSMAATGTDGRSVSTARTLDQRTNAVIRKADGDALFVISGQSEKQMASEFGLKAFAALVGGPLLTLGGAWFLMLLVQSGQFFRNVN
jgi:hypothetical protein